MFQNDALPARLPVCDHYADTEKPTRKPLALQRTLGPVLDITFGYEDGTTIGQERARAKLAAALIDSDDDHFNRIGVHTHDPNHNTWTRDVGILVDLTGRRLAYVTVSEVCDVMEVAHVTDRINQAAKATDIARHLPIHVLIKTHGTLAQMFDVASLVQVECLGFGLVDFVSVHNDAVPGAAMGSPEQFEHPLIRHALADTSATCHAHGKVPSHNIGTDIKHPDRAGADVTHARNEFGYLRKWSIHPDQTAPIISAFRPSHEEVTHASAILTSTQDTAWEPIQYGGRLHNHVSYHY